MRLEHSEVEKIVGNKARDVDQNVLGLVGYVLKFLFYSN